MFLGAGFDVSFSGSYGIVSENALARMADWSRQNRLPNWAKEQNASIKAQLDALNALRKEIGAYAAVANILVDARRQIEVIAKESPT
jgi:hypothetical protein